MMIGYISKRTGAYATFNLDSDHCIGTGAFGEVYRLEQKDFVCKAVRINLNDPKTYMTLYTELSVLDHLGRLEGYVYDVKAAKAYIIMDYFPGIPFAQRLDQSNKHDASIIKQFRALESKGIIHMDVNANNIIVDLDNSKGKWWTKIGDEVTIIDFGISLWTWGFPTVSWWPYVLEDKITAVDYRSSLLYWDFWQNLRFAWCVIFVFSRATWLRCTLTLVAMPLLIIGTLLLRRFMQDVRMVDEGEALVCQLALMIATVLCIYSIAVVSFPAIEAMFALGQVGCASGAGVMMGTIVANGFMSFLANLGAVCYLPVMIPVLVSELILFYFSGSVWMHGIDLFFGDNAKQVDSSKLLVSADKAEVIHRCSPLEAIGNLFNFA